MAKQPPITPQQAERIFAAAVEKNARDPAALYDIGVSAHQVGRNDIAVDLFAKAIVLDPAVAAVWVGMGMALRAQKKLPEAADAYRRALALQHDNAEAHNNLGNVLLAAGDRQGALACYEDALRCRTNYPEAHFNAGVLLHQLGRPEDSAAHLRTYLEQESSDALGAGVLLARLGFGDAPPQASPKHMEALYRARSATWDNEGDYRAHEHVARALAKAVDEKRDLTILDAGCGTGLVGELIAPLARRLEGVDLSLEMLEKARQKGVYAALHHGDLVAFLDSAPRYDAIASAATLIHFGDLAPALKAAFRALDDGGWFVFSLLSGEGVEEGFAPATSLNLARGGCYAHDPAYVAATANAAGFSVESIATEIQEYEQTESGPSPVLALIVTLRRQ